MGTSLQAKDIEEQKSCEKILEFDSRLMAIVDGYKEAVLIFLTHLESRELRNNVEERLSRHPLTLLNPKESILSLSLAELEFETGILIHLRTLQWQYFSHLHLENFLFPFWRTYLQERQEKQEQQKVLLQQSAKHLLWDLRIRPHDFSSRKFITSQQWVISVTQYGNFEVWKKVSDATGYQLIQWSRFDFLSIKQNDPGHMLVRFQQGIIKGDLFFAVSNNDQDRFLEVYDLQKKTKIQSFDLNHASGRLENFYILGDMVGLIYEGALPRLYTLDLINWRTHQLLFSRGITDFSRNDFGFGGVEWLPEAGLLVGGIYFPINFSNLRVFLKRLTEGSEQGANLLRADEFLEIFQSSNISWAPLQFRNEEIYKRITSPREPLRYISTPEMRVGCVGFPVLNSEHLKLESMKEKDFFYLKKPLKIYVQEPKTLQPIKEFEYSAPNGDFQSVGQMFILKDSKDTHFVLLERFFISPDASSLAKPASEWLMLNISTGEWRVPREFKKVVQNFSLNQDPAPWVVVEEAEYIYSVYSMENLWSL